MKFVPKKKAEDTYRSIYITKELEEKINIIAIENKTSFNNVIISMIEQCLDEK